MAEIKFIDLFCGTGGFSKGFENCKKVEYKAVLGLDVLPVAISTFKLNHPEAFCISNDIRKVRRHYIVDNMRIRRKDIDLIIGGPPCQGFSSIRPFRSSNDDDPRNNLFEEFASFVNYFRPKAFVMENVVGLATHKNGETMEILEECFHKIGYETNWMILNAANFGVPQKRERLIIIGVERGNSIVFPEPTHQYNGATIGYRNRERMLMSEERNLFNREMRLPIAITVADAIDDLPPVKAGECEKIYGSSPRNDYQRERRKNESELTLHIATKHTSRMLEIIKHAGKNINSIPKHLITSGFSTSYSRLDKDEPSPTITVNFVHPASNRCVHPREDRALTPREGARIQSFDDDFIFAGSRTQIVKQIGNAVPPLLGKTIGESLAKIW